MVPSARCGSAGSRGEGHRPPPVLGRPGASVDEPTHRSRARSLHARSVPRSASASVAPSSPRSSWSSHPANPRIGGVSDPGYKLVTSCPAPRRDADRFGGACWNPARAPSPTVPNPFGCPNRFGNSVSPRRRIGGSHENTPRRPGRCPMPSPESRRIPGADSDSTGARGTRHFLGGILPPPARKGPGATVRRGSGRRTVDVPRGVVPPGAFRAGLR